MRILVWFVSLFEIRSRNMAGIYILAMFELHTALGKCRSSKVLRFGVRCFLFLGGRVAGRQKQEQQMLFQPWHW